MLLQNSPSDIYQERDPLRRIDLSKAPCKPQKIEDLHCFSENEAFAGENSSKLRKALDEFDTYVVVNEALLPN
jgi:hypothetical protein